MSNWKHLSFLFTLQVIGLVAGDSPTCSGPALHVPSSCRTLTQGNEIIEEVTYTFTHSQTASNLVASTLRGGPSDAPRQSHVASSTPLLGSPSISSPTPQGSASGDLPSLSPVPGQTLSGEIKPSASLNNSTIFASKVSAASGASLPSVSAQGFSGQLDSSGSLNHAASTLKPSAASELAPSAAQSSSPMSTPGPVQTSSVITSGSVTITPVYQTTDYPEYSSITAPITTTTTDEGHHPIPLIIWPPGRGWKCILNCGSPGNNGNPNVVVPLPTEIPSPGNPGSPEDPNKHTDPSDPSTSSSTSTSSTTTRSSNDALWAVQTAIFDDFVIVTADGAEAAMSSLGSFLDSVSSAVLAPSTLITKSSTNSDLPLLHPPSKYSPSSLAATSQPKSKPASTTSPTQESISESSTSKTSTGKTSTSSATHSESTPTTTPTPRKNDGSTTCQMIWKDDMVEEKGKQHDWMYKIILSGSWVDEDSFHDKINDCTHGGELKSWTWKKQGDESYMAAFDLTKWPKGNEGCVADAITKQGSFGADEITCPDDSDQKVDPDLVTDLTRESMKDIPL